MVTIQLLGNLSAARRIFSRTTELLGFWPVEAGLGQ
jgi:hypothetical protein